MTREQLDKTASVVADAPERAPLLIGMMRVRGKPMSAARAAAHVAVMQGAELIYFNPDDVNFTNQSVSGWKYVRHMWVRVQDRLPDVVINDLPSRRHHDVWRQLSARVPFTSPPIGDKLGIWRRMSEAKFYRELQIPTEILTSFEHLLAILSDHHKVVVKPQNGSKGRDVWFIGQEGKGFTVNDGVGWHEFSRSDLLAFYEQKLDRRYFLAQRYIESKTKFGLPFDIRIHVRRNYRAKWEIVNIYPRIGSGKGIAANWSAGGSMGQLTEVLHQKYGEKAEGIHNLLKELGDSMPRRFQRLYDDRIIDALGIDLGLDESGRPWLFEVNSVPGAKLFSLEVAIYKVGYAILLATKARRGEDIVRDKLPTLRTHNQYMNSAAREPTEGNRLTPVFPSSSLIFNSR
jgi:glutathione synthase/RimK-type ligase-like ATP-grasp enzyme